MEKRAAVPGLRAGSPPSHGQPLAKKPLSFAKALFRCLQKCRTDSIFVFVAAQDGTVLSDYK